MEYPIDKKYYIKKKPELLKKFDEEVSIWRPVVVERYDEEKADKILREARKWFENLIPQIPYIGGDENHLTKSLVESAGYLAFYKAMKRHGKTAEETGKILYDAILAQIDKPRPPIPPAEWLPKEQFIEQRRKRAEKTKAQRYPGNYMFDFVIGDGREFDYGYDYTECASLKFYHNLGADEFTPFYCYLDFPICRVNGTGLSRTMTMSEGYEKCNHRIKIGGETKLEWPPPFIKRQPDITGDTNT
jgi:hypothetical protein